MTQSVFVTIIQIVNDVPHVLFVKRRDNKGSWYQPGGKIHQNTSMYNSALRWHLDQTRYGLPLADPTYARSWLLSNGNLVGQYVYLVDRLPGPLICKSGHYEHNSFVSNGALFSTIDIGYELYVSRLIPWAQAKMAIWAMHYFNTKDPLAHPDLLLKSDLGKCAGVNWTRPE